MTPAPTTAATAAATTALTTVEIIRAPGNGSGALGFGRSRTLRTAFLAFDGTLWTAFLALDGTLWTPLLASGSARSRAHQNRCRGRG
jgi:hypothetical protein